MKKKDSNNYWIIHRDIVGTACTFYVWELSSTGFSGPTAYILNITFSSHHAGTLKFSSDTKRFACPVHYVASSSGTMLSGEFDAETGQISNLQWRNIGAHRNIYAFEFSPSGEHLFITAVNNGYFAHITWYDLRNTTNSATNLNKFIHNLQIYDNGRIYGITLDTRTLHVIMDPEEGKNAEIRTFPNYLKANATLGLPTFAANFVIINITGEMDLCINTPTNFNVSLPGSNNAYTIWNFGDGSVGEKDTNVSSGTQNRSHIYTKPGKYNITVKVYDSGDIELAEDSFDVNVSSCIMPVNPNIHIFH